MAAKGPAPIRSAGLTGAQQVGRNPVMRLSCFETAWRWSCSGLAAHTKAPRIPPYAEPEGALPRATNAPRATLAAIVLFRQQKGDRKANRK